MRLGGAVLLSVPEASPFLQDLTAADVDLADPLHLRAIVGEPREQRGPAALFFFDPLGRGRLDMAVTEILPTSDPAIAELIGTCDPSAASESSLQDVESDLSVLRSGAEVVAASGWTAWGGVVAHLGVLSHPGHRRKGLARRVSADATRRAIDAGMVPQWRAREGNDASVALASSLGFELLGRQLTFRM